ncbi:hypothetical protein SB2_25560 [Methylobacterium radiotolerans]|nr:hypothetical protein SB3_28285 [Methylobacterium radiotolerans]KTS44103.1 hypothetical protein SB2_25560 [Methylobacterium radiotolerans]
MIRLYEVTARLYGQAYTRPVSARSPAAARYRAYLDADLSMPFREYLRATSVRLAPGMPPDDGYGYVRQAYKVDPRIGQRVTLKNEGKDWEGREGEIVYPGTSRQYVHVMFDDLDNPVVVHPLSVVFPALPATDALAAVKAGEDERRSHHGA